jgi:hypothetical protein
MVAAVTTKHANGTNVTPQSGVTSYGRYGKSLSWQGWEIATVSATELS